MKFHLYIWNNKLLKAGTLLNSGVFSLFPALSLYVLLCFCLNPWPYICWISCMAVLATAHYRQQGATKAKWDWGKLISDLNWATQICFSFVRQAILQKQNHLPAIYSSWKYCIAFHKVIGTIYLPAIWKLPHFCRNKLWNTSRSCLVAIVH